jgi:hypothetical protein
VDANPKKYFWGTFAAFLKVQIVPIVFPLTFFVIISSFRVRFHLTTTTDVWGNWLSDLDNLTPFRPVTNRLLRDDKSEWLLACRMGTKALSNHNNYRQAPSPGESTMNQICTIRNQAGGRGFRIIEKASDTWHRKSDPSASLSLSLSLFLVVRRQKLAILLYFSKTRYVSTYAAVDRQTVVSMLHTNFDLCC